MAKLDYPIPSHDLDTYINPLDSQINPFFFDIPLRCHFVSGKSNKTQLRTINSSLQIFIIHFHMLSSFIACATMVQGQISCVRDGVTVFGNCECSCDIVSTGVETPPFCRSNGAAPCDDCAVHLSDFGIDFLCNDR